MTFHYTPNVGYGPLRFEMTPAEVENVLGTPSAFRSPLEDIALPDDDDDLRRHYGALMVMDFPETRTSHQFPQLSFYRDGLVSVTLFDIRQPLIVDGIDLFARNRKETLAALAKKEAEYFWNGEYFLFPSQGIEMPDVKHARKMPYVSLVYSTHAVANRDFNFLEPSTALD